MEQYLEFVTNHYILSTSWAVVFGMLMYTFVGARLRGFDNINPAIATQLINRDDAVILDVPMTSFTRWSFVFQSGLLVVNLIFIIVSLRVWTRWSSIEKLSGSR